MKTRLTMRAALALGLPAVARGAGRLERFRRKIIQEAGHEVGRGNVITATVLIAIYVAAR